jgi:hypothetical protein
MAKLLEHPVDLEIASLPVLDFTITAIEGANP